MNDDEEISGFDEHNIASMTGLIRGVLISA